MRKVLFNANILSCNDEFNSNRSGIFIMACDLLAELVRRNDLEVSLYCDPEYFRSVQRYAKSFLPGIQLYTLSTDPLRRLLIAGFDSFKPGSSVLMKAFRRLSRKVIRRLNSTFEKRDRRFFEQFDIAFSVLAPFPVCIHGSDSIITVTTIHDLIPYVIHEFDLRPDYWLFRLFEARRPSDYYCCISHATKRDLLFHFPDIRDDHAPVIYNGVSDRFRRCTDNHSVSVLEKYHLKPGQYMFSIGSLVPHKNLRRQLEAFSLFVGENSLTDFSYAVAGGSLAGHSEGLISEIGSASQIVWLGYVPDEDVPVLYSNALFSSFTSLYEGFGLPALEAMKCGCPLVASKVSSLPEVCGDAAVLIDPEDLQAHVDVYSELYWNESLRNELVEKGFRQAGRFTWEKSAENLAEFFNSIEVDNPEAV